MTGRHILTAALAMLLAIPSPAQKARDFSEMCDTLAQRLKRRTTVDLDLKMTKVLKKGNTLDLYFNSELAYYPWHKGDVEWFKTEVRREMEKVSSSYSLGTIYTSNYKLNDLITPMIGSGGRPSNYEHKVEDPRMSTPRFISRVNGLTFPKGMADRYIALWQSHGRYYDEASDEWIWQRAPLHNTVEDMFTQSFVLPFLIPMLENAGAYVITPRERDIQWREVIIDNDPGFKGPRPGKIRKVGVYRENGSWIDGGIGFADVKASYTFDDNPFTSGTSRKAYCSSKGNSSVVWTPNMDERGEYAVYISYSTFENSNTAAHYTVRHMGGESEFIVNQTRGGGTWIYLGTFEFDKGTDGYVMLTNQGSATTVVSADAVKIGGGMGKLERGGRVSGMASSAEGAHYWMQWAGVDKEITRGWDTDYTNDYASRGAWTKMMKEDKHIPVDLSLAFHSDAGYAPKDSIIGTLAIYTLREDGKRTFKDGRDRIINRLLCDYVQSQVVNDIRADFRADWSRRGTWDKSYSESRTTGVPAMILETLSHQNFADMKLGLDPSFRFTLCRAVYKGLLKTLSEFYGCEYVVQPLPVSGFRAALSDGVVRLSWEPVTDSKEPTAVPEGYIVYTRVDGGAFDQGKVITEAGLDVSIDEGHIYSFKVEAFNKGGKSFPSEILSAGIPAGNRKSEVAIVNNFTRVSAPSYVDSPEYAGFTGNMDSGVPYIREINYIGESYEFDRSIEFIDNDYPGHGASFTNHAGEIVAGNTFDYPYVHGRILMELGHPFWSVSAQAFRAADCQSSILDLICGKQGGEQEVFSDALMAQLREYTAAGGNILASGCNMASDSRNAGSKVFAAEVLGIQLANKYGTPGNLIADMEFHNARNPLVYCVEKPDAIKAAGKKAKVWLKYPESGLGAAVWYNADKYRSVSIGVPIETLKEESSMKTIVQKSLEYLDGGSAPVYHGKVD